jgi:hypothetical protein
MHYKQRMRSETKRVRFSEDRFKSMVDRYQWSQLRHATRAHKKWVASRNRARSAINRYGNASGFGRFLAGELLRASGAIAHREEFSANVLCDSASNARRRYHASLRARRDALTRKLPSHHRLSVCC